MGRTVTGRNSGETLFRAPKEKVGVNIIPMKLSGKRTENRTVYPEGCFFAVPLFYCHKSILLMSSKIILLGG